LALQSLLAAIAVVASLVAGAALLKARRLSRRLERLSESYWELRYEHGQLNARLARLEGPEAAVPSDPGVPLPPGAAAFVPLSALRTR
jgi:hypothetical protein